MSGMSATTLGGVVVRHGADALAFLPSAVAVAVLPMPEVARLPGAPEGILGVTVHRGEAVPVLAVGTSRSAMVVCSYLGETFGLVGVEVLGAGRFAMPEGPALVTERVLFEGEVVPPFDVAAVFARAFGERAAPATAPQAG